MELRAAGHHLLDPLEVVGVDGLFELPDRFQGFDMGFELGPARGRWAATLSADRMRPVRR